LLYRIQQKVYDEARFIPVWHLGFLCASGPRVAASGLGLMPVFIYSAPYEEVRLKSCTPPTAKAPATAQGGRGSQLCIGPMNAPGN
jgi:hypothetical protein